MQSGTSAQSNQNEKGNLEVQHVFIVGSKGIPGNYGGYETFVDKLTEYHQNEPKLKYHVACKAKENSRFSYHNADCFKINVPDIGPAQAIYYDVAALKNCVAYIKKNHIPHPIVYILACRIGPFAAHFQRAIHKLGGKLYINPDGHEWMRAKWSAPVRRYWKTSERLMTKHCDLLICDSKNIEKYIHDEYGKYHPQTTYISYGAETRKSELADNDPKLLDWYQEKGLSPRSYYLVVGRFVPENNYETMIREFMKSNSKRDFALITNVSQKFLEELKDRTHFDRDPRIKFVGTVYDKELLMKIRENAYAYLHGHEVGGTNPSLLEALGSTDLNLLLDVGFNREVAEDSALYWNKKKGNLAALIDYADNLDEAEKNRLGRLSTRRIEDVYSWNSIAEQYKTAFTEKG
ncbi:beta 1-4 rhamnosyltransferase Cps2T [Bifidobacterium thermophilum]|uniref:beta 1-4 rhamnosyltransferase Cps2T n=1 Tax=Bifidobacterium thermophilum TaxID=33905 RepID=UPI003994B6DF